MKTNQEIELSIKKALKSGFSKEFIIKIINGMYELELISEGEFNAYMYYIK
jgi:hypothetical protein